MQAIQRGIRVALPRSYSTQLFDGANNWQQKVGKLFELIKQNNGIQPDNLHLKKLLHHVIVDPDAKHLVDYLFKRGLVLDRYDFPAHEVLAARCPDKAKIGTIHALLKHERMNANCKNIRGHSLLNYTLLYPQNQTCAHIVVKHLAKKGLKVNPEEYYHHSPLLDLIYGYWKRENKLRTMEALLKYYPGVTKLTDREGKTAWDYVGKEHLYREEMYKLLKGYNPL